MVFILSYTKIKLLPLCFKLHFFLFLINFEYIMKKISQIKGILSIIQFKEGKNTILFCPALEITGYGATEIEAKKSFEITLQEFLRYTIKKKTLHKELERLGWTIKGKKIIQPEFSDLLLKNKDLHSIVDKKEFRKFDEVMEIPA